MSKLIDKTKEFLSMCEGYHQALKCIHWSTTNKSEHTLVDDIDSSVLGYEDRIAESTMGLLGTRYGFGDLKTLLPSAKTTESLLKELKEDVERFRSEWDDKASNAGIFNILDEFIEEISKWNYLRTLK